MNGKKKILSVVGARPQFIKLAPMVNAFHKEPFLDIVKGMEHIILHTGQHYDYEMNKVFFDELGIPKPDHNLEVGSATPGKQTGEIIRRAERVLLEENPYLVLVYGDTNSTLGGALAAAKLQIPVAHVEAGLRSYNRKMPEEINRILTDCCSDILFCPTENASKNLKKEGYLNIANYGKLIDLRSVKSPHLEQRFPISINVGDIMYDSTLLCFKSAEKKSKILNKLKLEPKKYFLATVHRAENSDHKDRMLSILHAFSEISNKRPVIFPVHPRTKKNLKAFHLYSSPFNRVQMIEPLSYFDMLILEKNADKILTDSGGIQKEAYFFKTPCITLREETEWIETLEEDYNVLTGHDKEKIINAALSSVHFKFSSSPFGDGHAAERILSIISYERFE